LVVPASLPKPSPHLYGNHTTAQRPSPTEKNNNFEVKFLISAQKPSVYYYGNGENLKTFDVALAPPKPRPLAILLEVNTKEIVF
jgi:hypothetical protein